MVVPTNPKDPLNHTMQASGRDLFNKFEVIAHDGQYSAHAVIEASLNTLINALRQTYATRSQAEQRWDELTGKMKGVLLDHYDPVTQKRKNIFPFTQHVQAALVQDKDKF